MGFIRGVLFVIASVLLFIAFIVGSTFLTMSMSLDYEVVKPELNSLVYDSVIEEYNLEGQISQSFILMETYCQNNTEFVLSPDNVDFALVFPCEVVMNGSEAVVTHGLDSVIEKVYYDDYECGFWDCFELSELPLFLVSEKAKDYWNSKFYLILLISIVLLATMFFLIENKTNLPFVAGGLMIISSFTFSKIETIIGFFSDKSFLSIITIFFTQSYDVFLTCLLIGIALVVLGIVLKLFKVGFKISNLFSKFNKPQEKVVVKEVKASPEKSK